MAISLKRLVSRKENTLLLQELLQLVPEAVSIVDTDDKLLLGDFLEDGADVNKLPIQAESEVLGWVKGRTHTQSIASLLNHLVNNEVEKKSLVTDGLEKYKEINLLYRVSSELGTCLDIKEIANFVLSESKRLVRSTSGALLLFNSQRDQLQKVAAFGQEEKSNHPWLADSGIVGDIIAHNTAEIIDDVTTDDRFIHRDYPICSLLCTALSVKGKVLGVIILNHELSIAYTAADLKLLMAIASQAAAAIDNNLLHEHKLLEERIKANLGRYVAAEVVNAIFDSQGETSLAPVKKHVTILFSDIRNFTSQCELLAPEQVVEYLNEYFTAMVKEIFRYGGTVNKFVGDMIVDIFVAPYPIENNEQKAIETAIAMQKCLKLMPVAWIRENFHTGIGISAGKVVVGNVGSPQHMDYTAIGDEVNIASRLQSLAKGGQILVSRNIYELNQDKFKFRTIGSVNVKGKHKAVEVFEVIY